MASIIRNDLETQSQKIVMLIGEVGDGTKNPRDASSGTLSYGGQSMLRSMLMDTDIGSRVIFPHGMPSVKVITPGAAQQIGQMYSAADYVLGITGGFVTLDQSRGIGGTYS